MNWLPTKVSSSFTKGTPPLNLNTNPSSEDTAASFENAQFAIRDVLTEVLRTGVQQMLKEAIEREVADYIDDRKDIVDESGRRRVIRDGHLPEREIMTGLGPIAVSQPRVRDKRSSEQREVFSPGVLPKDLREMKSIEEMIPWLYLKEISTNDFPEASQSLLGSDAKGLSASTVTRLKAVWEDEYDEWKRRSLAGKHYVYIWRTAFIAMSGSTTMKGKLETSIASVCWF